MIEPFSVWLMPERDSRRQCRQIINKLSRKLQFPVYEPHCTLYGRLKCDPYEIEPLISHIATKHAEFSTKVKRIKTGNSKWKCLYFSLRINDRMKSMFSICKDNLLSYRRYAFDPHLSLAYGNYESDELLHFAERIPIPEKLNFSAISLVRTGETVDDWEVLVHRHFGAI